MGNSFVYLMEFIASHLLLSLFSLCCLELTTTVPLVKLKSRVDSTFRGYRRSKYTLTQLSCCPYRKLENYAVQIIVQIIIIIIITFDLYKA